MYKKLVFYFLLSYKQNNVKQNKINKNKSQIKNKNENKKKNKVQPEVEVFQVAIALPSLV